MNKVPKPLGFQSLLFFKALLFSIGILLFSGCQVEEKIQTEPVVVTLNSKYNRLHSHVLVRRINVPTEGFLDYAAYSKNILHVDPEWRAVHPEKKINLKSINFAGNIIDVKTLLDFTPLTQTEKNQPLAWTPSLERLLKWNFRKASNLANTYATISGERWGDTSDISQSFQEFGSLYFHINGEVKEAWVELEFKPWLNSFTEGLLDQDKDGYPEVWVQLSPKLFTTEMINELRGDYFSKVLTEPQVLDWANNLASRWYPSYNTDLIELKSGMVWPYENSPQTIKNELAGVWVANPLFILKGRPFEDTLYNAFEVYGMGVQKSDQAKRREGQPVSGGVDKGLGNRLNATKEKINTELITFGKGKWESWNLELSSFHQAVRQFASTEQKDIKGLIGRENTLVFRRELDYLLAQDEKLAKSTQAPVAVIAELKDYLAAKGIDFLFIPIPTKLDIYPELISSKMADSIPGNIPQPLFRKLLTDLAEARVETLDLLEPFLKIKSSSEEGKRMLYQNQDTHWTTLGLETTAQIISDRIQFYTWFDLKNHSTHKYHVRDTVFENLGDIQAQLTQVNKSKFGPEKILGRQVLDENGELYKNSDSSSIIVIGDSYTGVFETVGCRNAGVTSHIAKNLGAPVDLIMGWGGGPEAPSKLKNRGEEYLQNRKLVIWIMSVRDIFVYPGDWSQQ